jgi:NitT/TauT family transport system permease protein
MTDLNAMRHINRHPHPGHAPDAVLLPFVLLIAAWFIGGGAAGSQPAGQALPGLRRCWSHFRMAFTPDKRSGEYLFWVDTLVSLAVC